jgi:hypothetical protein
LDYRQQTRRQEYELLAGLVALRIWRAKQQRDAASSVASSSPQLSDDDNNDVRLHSFYSSPAVIIIVVVVVDRVWNSLLMLCRHCLNVCLAPINLTVWKNPLHYYLPRIVSDYCIIINIVVVVVVVQTNLFFCCESTEKSLVWSCFEKIESSVEILSKKSNNNQVKCQS